MITNQYVGELFPGVEFDVFVQAMKSDVRQAKLSVEAIKIKNNKGNEIVVQCTGDIADVIRKRKEITRFRCNKIGPENDKQEKSKNKAKIKVESED